MNMKTLYNLKSKTHNAAMGVTFFGGLLTFLPTMRQFIPPDYFGAIMIFIGLAFHYLRSITVTSVEEK